MLKEGNYLMRTWHRWIDNIQLDFNEIAYEVDESSGSRKDVEYVDYLIDYQLLKTRISLLA